MPGESTEDDNMMSACSWLRTRGVTFRKLTRYHLKIGPINFWPKTGTITVDGEPTRVPGKGLPALDRLLGKSLRAVAAEQKTPTSDDVVDW